MKEETQTEHKYRLILYHNQVTRVSFKQHMLLIGKHLLKGQVRHVVLYFDLL